MLDLADAPLIDDHSHAGLYERRRGRPQTLTDLEGSDVHSQTSAYRGLLREALTALHGESTNWSRGVAEQYTDGIEPAYSRLLDRLGIRAVMWDFRRLRRDNWPADRYRLVYWIDQFVCPFADASLWRGDEMQDALQEALDLAGLDELPAEFADYLEFISKTLERARAGLVGLKLLLGYQRSLSFGDVSQGEASRIYVEMSRGDLSEYPHFQDFMVRHLHRLSGQLELPLQIHASFGGPGSPIQIKNNDPSLLQPLLAEARTRVVLLHGGYPYISQACAVAWLYPHVFLDFSVLPTLFTRPLASWLEEWIELLPSNRILFGTDASSPEEYYTAAVNGRRQLGAALGSLRQSGVLMPGDASKVADRICYRNAVELYQLDDLL